MTDSTIFDDSNTNENPQQDTQPQGLQLPTEAVDFIGSGKKYQTVEDALKSVPHAQKHIQTLEQELQNLKEELVKRKTTAELLDNFKSGLPQENTPQVVEFDQDKLAELVDRTLTAKEQQRKAHDNVLSVVNKFTEKFGDKSKAEEAYAFIAKESGLSLAQLNSLAASSPSAVLKLAGLTTNAPQMASKPTGSINTQYMATNQPQQNASARVPKGASTRDLVNAWKVAGDKVKQQISTS
jgi:hypothetical protein